MPSTNPQNTIFLTKEEDERIRKTFLEKLQKSQSLRGQPRIPRETSFYQNQVATASLLSDFATSQPSFRQDSDTIPAFPITHPYPPCTLPIQSLQPIKLSELRKETHHHGRILKLKRISPVVKLALYSWTIVQEESTGEMERLEVFLHKERCGNDVLEEGEGFEILEPYFTVGEGGEETLRIDHLSDIICVDGDVARQSGIRDLDLNLALEEATAYKEKGNLALKQRNLLLAHKHYTNGLQLLESHSTSPDQQELSHNLHRNRSHINLLLNCLDEAKSDALSSLTHLQDQKSKDLDSKAYFRAGCAAYNLAEYQHAKEYFEAQMKLGSSGSCNFKDVVSRLKKVENRLKEEETGTYDWKKLKARLALKDGGEGRIDVASFTRNVKVGASPGRGRGLFASRDLEVGDILLCEKAFCVTVAEEGFNAITYDHRDDRIRIFPAGLSKSVFAKVWNNPSQVAKVMDLYSDYEGLGSEVVVRDGKAVVDAFQVHDLVARNSFGVGEGGCGVWVMASYANHDCVGNVTKESLGDLLVFRAKKRIMEGEEVVHCYAEGKGDYEERIEELRKTWGFECACRLCVAEEKDGEELRKKRREFASEMEGLVERCKGKRVGRVEVLKARKLEKKISETYDEDRWRALPKKVLEGVQKWLAEAKNS